MGFIARKLVEAEVTFTLEAEEEHERIGTHFLDGHDDSEERRAMMRQITEDYTAGNEWAWFSAKVTARWGEYSASTYLGCCSYESKADFEADHSYQDMKKEALEDLNKVIGLAVTNLSPLLSVE